MTQWFELNQFNLDQTVFWIVLCFLTHPVEYSCKQTSYLPWGVECFLKFLSSQNVCKAVLFCILLFFKIQHWLHPHLLQAGLLPCLCWPIAVCFCTLQPPADQCKSVKPFAGRCTVSPACAFCFRINKTETHSLKSSIALLEWSKSCN